MLWVPSVNMLARFVCVLKKKRFLKPKEKKKKKEDNGKG